MTATRMATIQNSSETFFERFMHATRLDYLGSVEMLGKGIGVDLYASWHIGQLGVLCSHNTPHTDAFNYDFNRAIICCTALKSSYPVHVHISALDRSMEFNTTVTELDAIAIAANIGLSMIPNG